MTPLPDPTVQPEFYKDVPMKRLLAWIVDMILIFVVCVIILPFTAFTGIFVFPLMLLVVGFAYRVMTIANGSGTWGMRLFSIELRRPDGSQMDLGSAFAHTFGYSISWAFGILQLVSVVLMATTERGQGLSDYALGTVMVNRRALRR